MSVHSTVQDMMMLVRQSDLTKQHYRPSYAVDIIPPHLYASLSYTARRIYTVVWNKIHRTDVYAVRCWNRNLGIRVNTARVDIPSAQKELETAGLLIIRCVGSKQKDLKMEYRLTIDIRE